MERTKQIVEPSGASSLAAVLSGKIDTADKKTVCLLSGGNIDVSFIHRVIELGLVSRHRRIKSPPACRIRRAASCACSTL